MLYHYVASDKTGKVVEGDTDAENLAQTLKFLSSKELRPVTVTSLEKKGGGVLRIFGGITVTDKVFLTKYLALMLRVGTDLLSAVNILIGDFENPAMRNFLIEVRENLTRGLPFHQAFGKYPAIFPATFSNLIKAAEASGSLQQTFEDLSVSMSREAELRSRIRSAMVYPVILLVAAFAVLVFLVTFALPKIARVFAESGINPPFFSRIVFGAGLFIGDHIVVISILFVGLLAGGLYFFVRTAVGRHMLDGVLSRTPYIQAVYREVAIQRLVSTLALLLKAGLPIIQAIEVTADAVGAEKFRYALLRIAHEGLAKGLTIGEAFRREAVFPKVLVNLVAISEKAGHLEEVLQTLGEFYATSIDASIKSLVAILEPILIMCMGGIVVLIALSIIVPIYQLTTQF
ncbi:MAG: type II secretion system F family protein [Candidatus Liptonbacteria bacterium]|nr:type II secretion system F family protein [Candidatus Liptonbacteria bacterium]MBI3114856.1 type II secretion system F family protein [Candidatus Harrisonbacteria bacterium]